MTDKEFIQLPKELSLNAKMCYLRMIDLLYISEDNNNKICKQLREQLVNEFGPGVVEELMTFFKKEYSLHEGDNANSEIILG